jgi:hypothetical protein
MVSFDIDSAGMGTLKLQRNANVLEHIRVRGKYTSTKEQKLTSKYTRTKVQILTPERHANVVEHVGIGHALSDAFSEEQGSIDSKRRVRRIWKAPQRSVYALLYK